MVDSFINEQTTVLKLTDMGNETGILLGCCRHHLFRFKNECKMPTCQMLIVSQDKKYILAFM